MRPEARPVPPRRRVAAGLVVGVMAAATLLAFGGNATGAAEEITAPRLVSESFTPTRINTSYSDQTVVVDVGVTDDMFWRQLGLRVLSEPVGVAIQVGTFGWLVSGSSNQRLLTGERYVPEFSAFGTLGALLRGSVRPPRQ